VPVLRARIMRTVPRLPFGAIICNPTHQKLPLLSYPKGYAAYEMKIDSLGIEISILVDFILVLAFSWKRVVLYILRYIG